MCENDEVCGVMYLCVTNSDGLCEPSIEGIVICSELTKDATLTSDVLIGPW